MVEKENLFVLCHLFLWNKLQLVCDDVLIVLILSLGAWHIQVCGPHFPFEHSALPPVLHFTFYGSWFAWKWCLCQIMPELKIFTQQTYL